MKRSEINQIIKDMERLLEVHKFALPPFCQWDKRDWESKDASYNEIRENMLGWDVTDYGLGNFNELGLTLITLRNGNLNQPSYRKSYAEKIMMLKEGQLSPMHFHWNKMEDIINRGGGNILFKLFNADLEGNMMDTDVEVNMDGRKFYIKAGDQVTLKPGESLTLYPYCYHDFSIEPGTGDALIGEVSMVNDDHSDNRFYEPIGRFPKIEEDELIYRLLCNEYPPAK